MAAVDHGFDLPAEQFLGFEHEKLRGRRSRKSRGGENFGGQCASAHEEVDLDLNAVAFPPVARIGEVPLTQGVLVHAVLQFVLETGGDLFDSANDLWAFSLCGFAIDVRDVVQVDVNR